MRALTAAALAVLLAGGFATPALSQDTRKQDTKPDPKLVQRGEQLYATQKCSMCHSIQGKGNKAGPLDGVGARLSEEDMGTSNRLYGRSCVTCHSNIHGSNHASGNMFVR